MKYLELAKNEAKDWEREKPGFLNQVADFVLWPAEKAAEALIPDGIQDAVATAIQSCLSALAMQTARTFDADGIRSTVAKGKRTSKRKSEKGANELLAADDRAKQSWNWHIGFAVAEGAATGAAGFVGLAADVPALFTILLREIQEIGTCYGYDVTEKNEKEYSLHILRTGFASNAKLKMEFIISLKEFEQILINVTWKKMSAALAAKQISKQSLLAALRQYAKTLGYELTKRKALQLVPIIGAIVGASLNGTLANDIGKAAYMSYRRRWIAERGGPRKRSSVKAP
jgi:uncharacterized protein (DUF697 family)